MSATFYLDAKTRKITTDHPDQEDPRTPIRVEVPEGSDANQLLGALHGWEGRVAALLQLASTGAVPGLDTLILVQIG